MDIAKNITQAQKMSEKAKRRRKTIGFTPTMGALHAGHTALIRAAHARCGFVAVSIFVNPTQFAPGEDYSRYPRTLTKDIALLRKEKVDLLFLPKVREMYPTNFSSWVNEDCVSRGLCGARGAGHFKGVCTIVAKLFHIIEPDIAYFGQKDFQQAAVIRRMARDLNFKVQIKTIPTVREPDGLAMSSRNRYLSTPERARAAKLYEALCHAQKMIRAGERDPTKISDAIKRKIVPIATAIDYISITDPDTLKPCRPIRKKTLIAIAVRIGNTRLIDNILINL
ncbi:MAG: pantoate--beta-alanine ligase [Candidatus Omnitrophota bacterium]